jgi:hypothetical protein
MTNQPLWRKASASASNSQCVELADTGATILMRDSKDPDGGHLTFDRAELAALIISAKTGELDDLL